MKVDKAVCTNETLEDLHRAMRYEAVFSTLIENKILSIKRECESKKNKNRKKRRRIGKLFFGRKKKDDHKTSAERKETKTTKCKAHTSRIDCNNSGSSIVDEMELIIVQDKIDHNELGAASRSVIVGGCNPDEMIVDKQLNGLHDTKFAGSAISHKDSSIISDGSSIQTATSRRLSTESVSCPSSRRTPLSTHRDPSLLMEQERRRLRVLEAKSISAQCSPIFPHRDQPHYSAASILQQHQQHQLQQQQPQQHHSHVQFHPQEGSSSAAAINTRKIFSRQNTSEDSQANVTFSSMLIDGPADRKPPTVASSPASVVKRQQHQHQQNERPDANGSTCSGVANRSRITIGSGGKKEKYDDGIINSFNQLTQQTTTMPVITTTQRIQPTTSCDKSNDSKLQRLTSTSTGSSAGVPTGCCARAKAAHASNDVSNSDDDIKWKKRKHRRGHRCSDPVLVYPSTSSRLPHCILSMPPNQPIQLQYDDDFIYDVSLQMATDKNDDLEAIVPGPRRHKHKHHHHHHHHHKRKRHKRKILVHDLDAQSVKVIDPDDLPQRARWAIIATACFFLIMCLLLVGVTLRMTPLIDEIVRNERFALESLNRKFSKNLTDTADQLAAGEDVQ